MFHPINIWITVRTVHTSYNLNMTRVGHARTTRVTHTYFCHIQASTHNVIYLRV